MRCDAVFCFVLLLGDAARAPSTALCFLTMNEQPTNNPLTMILRISLHTHGGDGSAHDTRLSTPPCQLLSRLYSSLNL